MRYICGLFKIKSLRHASENKMRANKGTIFDVNTTNKNVEEVLEEKIHSSENG